MLVDFWSFSKEKKNAALTAHTIHTHQKKKHETFFSLFFRCAGRLSASTDWARLAVLSTLSDSFMGPVYHHY
jgi:hypothetical protein